MRFATAIASTTAMTLEATVGRLAAHRMVDGILLMGTTGTVALTPDSDYDLLLVLDVASVPVRMINTWVDGRLTEIYCTTPQVLQRIGEDDASWPDRSEEGAIVRWLRAGHVAFDRAGRLDLAQKRARATIAQTPLASEQDLYDVWQKVGYNVAQIRRYLASEDALTREVVDWRLLYSLDEVKQAYFLVRDVPWRGEKQAIRNLTVNAPDFLDVFRRCLAETDRDRKVARYVALARTALAPVGELWEQGRTMAVPGPGYGEVAHTQPLGTVEDALAVWRELLGEGSDR